MGAAVALDPGAAVAYGRIVAQEPTGGRRSPSTDAFDDWVTRARVGEAAARQRRQWWLEQQLRTGTTWTGVLAALAEHGGEARVATTHTVVRGRVVALERDHCELATDGQRWLLPLAHIQLVGGDHVPAADGPPPGPHGLADRVRDEIDARRPVRVMLSSGTTMTVTDGWVGQDLVVLRQPGSTTWECCPLGVVESVMTDGGGARPPRADR